MTAEIILLGRSGQVATAIAALAATSGRTIRQLARPDFDFAKPDSIAPVLELVLAAAAPIRPRSSGGTAPYTALRSMMRSVNVSGV